MLTERELPRDEIELVWSIDRSEVIDNIYYHENGALVLKPEHYDMKGWPRGEAEKYTPILLDCFDRGGWLYGVFDDEVTLTPGLSRAREGHAVPNALTPVPSPAREGCAVAARHAVPRTPTPVFDHPSPRSGEGTGVRDEAVRTAGDRTSVLVAVVVLESKFIGRNKDQLQLKFMHVSSAYRNQGLGNRLFELAKAKARERSARRLYISATPSENTIRLYLRLGCTVTNSPDPDLFALEPEDIHVGCKV